MERGELPDICAASRPGHLSPAGDVDARALAGRLVDLRDRRRPVAPRHLRLHRARSAHLRAQAVVERSVRTARVSSASGPSRIPVSRAAACAGFVAAAPSGACSPTHGVFSSVLRVPITFPVEKIDGVMIAGMCVPDLRGTPGVVHVHHERGRARPAWRRDGRDCEGRRRRRHPRAFESAAPGNAHRARRDSPCTKRGGERFELETGKQRVELKQGSYTPWVRLGFRAARGVTVNGIARFLPVSLDGSIAVYVTPIHIDPEHPAMPVSYPSVFSIHLAKLLGPFGTLGLLEDTSALNDGAIDEQGFLDQAYLYHDERRAMWSHTLDRLRGGLAVCVFDISDRLQHMFFRYLDPVIRPTPAATSHATRVRSTRCTGAWTYWSARRCATSIARRRCSSSPTTASRTSAAAST